jgi:acetoin utilization deacetylase AcuC-like enzyme
MLIFDHAATLVGHASHPECPARLINTEAYLLDKHPDWIWVGPKQASNEEVLRVHRPGHLDRLRRVALTIS